MKSAIRFLIFASALTAVVFAYPGGHPSESESDEDYEKVQPILVLSEGSDAIGGGFPSGFFNGGFSFDDLFTRLQSAMSSLRQHIPNFQTYPDGGGFFGFSNIPEGANTTSTTKVINGHVVTVNETTYTDGDDNQETIVRVRIVDIKPEDDAVFNVNPNAEDLTVSPGKEDITTPSNTDRSVESVETDSDNEIPDRLGKLTPA